MRYLTRRKIGKKYCYFDGETEITDKKDIARIDKLAIPPAWRHVQIAKGKSAKIQAKGVDSSGRMQSIYHPTYRIRQEKLKFDRILRFAKQLPALRRQLDKDVARKRLNKEKVLATIIKLIDMEYFRVGNEQYAREHQTYGITTMRSKHADIHTNTVTFNFVGKSGKEHVKSIDDPQLARIIKQLDEKPGYEIFRYEDKDGHMHDLHASDVNAYIKRYMGEEFTAKDFRTWGGTLLATSALLKEVIEESPSKTATKKIVAATVKSVAKKLGNTPAIARASYIDPRVIVAFENGVTLPKVRATMANMRPRKYLSVDEQCVLEVLQK